MKFRHLFLIILTNILLFSVASSAWAIRTITINPTEGPKGTVITVTGKGFKSGMKVTIKIGDCNSVSNIKVDSTGGFTAEIESDCEKDGKYSVQAFEYDANDNLLGKSDAKTFTQKGRSSKQLLTSAISIEFLDNALYLITHDERGKIIVKDKHSTCRAGITTAEVADCGQIPKINWGVTTTLESQDAVKTLLTYSEFPGQPNPIFHLLWYRIQNRIVTDAGKVKGTKLFEDIPHFVSVGSEMFGSIIQSGIFVNPDLYFVSRTPANTIFQEAQFNPNNGTIVPPFKNLLSIRNGAAIGAFSSPTGDIAGLLTRGVGTVETIHKVGSETGKTILVQRPNVYGVSVDITSTIQTTSGPSRLAVYSVTIQNGATFTRGIFSRMFNSQNATLVPRGSENVIQPFQNSPLAGLERYFQNVAVSNDAGSVIYTSYDAACKKDVLWYQKVNPTTGSKVGGRTPLINCASLANAPFGIHAVDLLRTQ
jgi:hypothetical protein